MKIWVSKVSAVESNGVPGMVGSTLSAAAIEWLNEKCKPPHDLALRSTYDASKAITSRGEKSASAKRARMLVTLSVRYQGLIKLFHSSGKAYQMAPEPSNRLPRARAGGDQGRT